MKRGVRFSSGGVFRNPLRVILSTEVPVTRKLKPVEADLDDDIQEAVRSLPVRLPDGSLATVGDLVAKARECLLLANEAVQGNALIQTTANFLMKQEKRRGHPSIQVRLDGTAVLIVGYGEEEPSVEVLPLKKTAKLPSLEDLRDQAAEAGVDISDLGRKKKKIIARLEQELAGAESPRHPFGDEVRESDLDLPQVSLPSRNR